MFRVGLNPYGIAYSIGLAGAGTPQANPKPLGLNGFLDLVDRNKLSGVEVPVALLKNIAGDDVERVRERIHSNGKYAVLMHGIPWGDLAGALDVAKRFRFPIVRLHLTAILCGARADLGKKWLVLLSEARAQLKIFACKAADSGITVTIEDHQDLTSGELLEICEECGDNVGICLDTGNPLSVAEEPVQFARTVASRVRHVHLKDYRIFKQAQGYTLVRCPIGEGVIPFKKIARELKENGAPKSLPASIEPGALERRYIRLLSKKWWTHYPRGHKQTLLDCLSFVWPHLRREPVEQTPWEKNAEPDKIVEYEKAQLFFSMLNLMELGWIDKVPKLRY